MAYLGFSIGATHIEVVAIESFAAAYRRIHGTPQWSESERIDIEDSTPDAGVGNQYEAIRKLEAASAMTVTLRVNNGNPVTTTWRALERASKVGPAANDFSGAEFYRELLRHLQQARAAAAGKVR